MTSESSETEGTVSDAASPRTCSITEIDGESSSNAHLGLIAESRVLHESFIDDGLDLLG